MGKHKLCVVSGYEMGDKVWAFGLWEHKNQRFFYISTWHKKHSIEIKVDTSQKMSNYRNHEKKLFQKKLEETFQTTQLCEN